MYELWMWSRENWSFLRNTSTTIDSDKLCHTKAKGWNYGINLQQQKKSTNYEFRIDYCNGFTPFLFFISFSWRQILFKFLGTRSNEFKAYLHIIDI